MKVYLVGGAVRDKLLGIPVKERDWVVVGGNKDQLLAQSYQQVGRDFPVFLHPKTQEEYALARKERKLAPGYHGFACDTDEGVTLEEDLMRRDLTINAMALDDQGQLIDPYGGARDLQAKLLRHVSPAFSEDPVRVLRIARFAARFHHLGFTVAPETRSLMYQMVKNGEMSALVAERVWQEWQRSLEEKNPEQFIEVLRSCGALAVILPEINRLFGVPNPPQYHHEIDSGIHSLLSLQAAVKIATSPKVRFAALVHDLGKALSPMNEWPKHIQHEEKGALVVESLCQRLRIPTDYCKFAMIVARLHLTIHRLFELRANTVVKIMERADAFRRPGQFNELLLACQADAMGCGRDIQYQQMHYWQKLLEVCLSVSAKTFVEAGLQGEAIKSAIHQQRVAQVEAIITSWNKDEKQ